MLLVSIYMIYVTRFEGRLLSIIRITKRKFVDFKEGDMVVVRIRPERYPKDTCMELHSKDVGPYKVLKKISSNAYVLDLPEKMRISNIFNIENLTLCSNPKDFTTNGGPNAHLPPTPRLKEEIEDVIDYQIVSTRGGDY